MACHCCRCHFLVHDALRIETEKLRRSWMQHDAAWLRDYLVSSIEDPRINLQSIFSRHFLIRSALWKTSCSVPNQTLEWLMEHECRFSAVMSWLIPSIAGMSERGQRADLLNALERGIENTDTVEIPAFVLQTFRRLPIAAGEFHIPNYIRDFPGGVEPTELSARVPEHAISTFIDLWRKVSHKFDGPNHGIRNPPYALSVLEPGCGSANDYRFLHEAGLTALLNYTGIDLCEKNIENARTLLPKADFRIGNVFQIEAADNEFDVCFFHDLLEHLSLEGLKTAIREICRVTRHSICAGFFQMHRMDDHIVREVDDYHLNTLSVSSTCELFKANGFSATVIPIAAFLRERFGCAFTHNPNAYTLVLTRSDPPPG